MNSPDYVCIDGLDRAATLDGWTMRGWWLGVSPPQCAVLETSEGIAAPLWLGHRRDDLAAAFPESRGAGTSGFLVFVPAPVGAAPTSLPPSPARWWFSDADATWRSFPADLASRTPQGHFPSQLSTTPPPPAVLEAARGAADVESRLRIAMAGRRALTLRLDIINKCNLRCVMCHYSEDDIFKRPARSVTPEQFESWFTPLARHVHEVMLSCADEPLMSRHFSDIVRLLRRIAPHVAIRLCTNATLMNASIARVLVEQQVDQVLFSFDACTRQTLEAIRRGAEYERVLHNILRLSRLKESAGSRFPVLGVNFVMMAQNIHEAPQFVELAHELGVATIDFRHLVNGYDRFKLQDEQLSHAPARFDHYRAGIIEAAQRLGVAVYLPPLLETTERWTPAADEPTVTLDEFHAAIAGFDSGSDASPPALVDRPTESEVAWPSTWELFRGVYCMRPFTEVFIRDQHEVLPCPWHHQVLGDLAEGDDLAAIFAGERFTRLRRNMFEPDGDPHCHGCPFKSMELPGDRVG